MIEKNMKSIKIYTATKGKKEDTQLYKSLDRALRLVDGVVYPTHYEENNTKSLQKCYNSFIRDARTNNVDIAVFIHDDVRAKRPKRMRCAWNKRKIPLYFVWSCS